MPVLGAALDFTKNEARNLRAHILGTAPSTPVTGQMYYNSGDNTLYWWDGTQWVSARGGASATPQATTSTQGTIQLSGDLAGTAVSPQIAAGVITDADVNSANKDGSAGVASMRTLGTGATQAAAGNDSRFTDSRAPTGAAGGDLTGSTYPSPVIANGAVTSAKIADGTITDTDVAAANKDGAVGVASMRTIGTGAQQAMAGSTRLDTIAAPTTPVGLNNQRISSLADPTAAQDAATRNYVDNVATGLDAKASVHAATTANIANLAGGAPNTLDGVTLAANDRVLVKDQTTQSANGIYTVTTLGTGSNGTWARASDMDTWAEVPAAFTWVEQGTANGDSGWVCTADTGGTLGTTNITWTQFTGTYQITAGAGVTKTGNSLSANVDGTTIDAAGAGTSLEVKAGGIGSTQLANGAVDVSGAKITGVLQMGNGGTGANNDVTARTNLKLAGYYSTLQPPSGPVTSWTILQAGGHYLRAAMGLVVQVQNAATGAVELPDISINNSGDVTITYSSTVAANSKVVTIIG
jgi:hypothetical protein